MVTDEPSEDLGSDDDESDERAIDRFDRSMEVELGDPQGDREQKLDEPNLVDPGSRTLATKVSGEQAIRDAENEDRRKIRRKIVYPVLAGAGLQFVVADGVFIDYACHRHWNLTSTVVTGWLSATVVQVVGIVLIVMRYLFPEDRH